MKFIIGFLLVCISIILNTGAAQAENSIPTLVIEIHGIAFDGNTKICNHLRKTDKIMVDIFKTIKLPYIYNYKQRIGRHYCLPVKDSDEYEHDTPDNEKEARYLKHTRHFYFNNTHITVPRVLELMNLETKNEISKLVSDSLGKDYIGLWYAKQVNIPNSCHDEERNNDETGRDCGGSSCFPCQDEDRCLQNYDCTSYLCENKKCTANTNHSNLHSGLFIMLLSILGVLYMNM